MALPDRLVVVDAGHVAQVGPPIEVYEQPVNLVAAACTGHVSTLTVGVEADGDGFWLVHPSFRHRAWRPSLANYVGATVVVALRPTSLRLTADGPVRAEVTQVSPVTGTITVALGDIPTPDHVEIATATPAHRRGDHVTFGIDEPALFDPLTGYHLP